MEDKEKNNEEFQNQENIYASFNQEQKNPNENSVPNVNTEKEYNNDYLESHTTITKASKVSKVILYGFYLLVILVGVVVFFMFRSDRYAFYLVKDEININIDSTYQIELNPKNVRYFDYLNYKYEIEDENIAKVDEFGTVTGISSGTTNLKISLSPGLTSKKMKINVASIEIESISLLLYNDGELQNLSTINMTPNQTYTLKAIANGNRDLNINVEYFTSNEDVAIVDESGNVTAVGAGTAVITGRRNDVSGSVTVKVVGDSQTPTPTPTPEKDKEVTDITLSENNIYLVLKNSHQLTATVLPSDAANKTVTWSSSDTSVATVSNGKITGKKVGTAVITAKTSNGKTANCKVTVTDKTVDVTSITLSSSTIKVKVNATATLTATIKPSNATDKKITWSSSDTSVATVSNGKITGKKVGTATITAKTSNGKTATCKVTVEKATEVKVTGIAFTVKGPITKYVGDSKFQLSVKISPDNATNKKVTWSSNKTSVAKVNSSGVVEFVGKGTATITAKTSDGGKTAEIQFTVKEKDTTSAPTGTQVAASEVTLSKTSLTVDKNKTATFTIKVSKAAGRIKVTSSDTSIVTVKPTKISAEDESVDDNCNSNGECFFDKWTVTYTVKGVKPGKAYIKVSTVDVVTYDLATVSGNGKVGILVK